MPNEKNIPQIICYGEIVWETLDDNPQLPAGTPLNIVNHLLKLKKTATIISRIGNDEPGKLLVHELKRKKITMDFCQVDGHYITGFIKVVSVEGVGIFHKIIYPSAWDFIEWRDYFPQLASACDYFVFDSLGARNIESRNTLYKILDFGKTNVFVVNLRTPHYNKKVIEYLLYKSNIVRMDVHELEYITQWSESYFDELSAMLFVKNKYNIQTLIVMRDDGGVMLNMGNRFFHHNGYGSNGSVKEHPAAADAFLAAFLSKLIDGSLPEEILNFTCAVLSVASKNGQAKIDYELKEVFALIASTA